jgi:hypothetical protein
VYLLLLLLRLIEEHGYAPLGLGKGMDDIGNGNGNENGGMEDQGVSLGIEIGKWSIKWCICMNPRTNSLVAFSLSFLNRYCLRPRLATEAMERTCEFSHRMILTSLALIQLTTFIAYAIEQRVQSSSGRTVVVGMVEI